MSKKELDTLIEQYFRSEVWASPTLNLEMLIEMIEDNYPDISAADPAGIGVDGVNPELVAAKVAAAGDVSREGVISTLTQMLGSADPGMVDRVMLQISNPQGLSVKGAPQAQINESLSAEQWAKMYRELLLMGVPADTMEAIRILKDSGLTAEELKAMLSQQTMTDLKGVQTAPVTGVGDRWSLEEEKERTKGEQLIIMLPNYQPSEAWGDPTHVDRKQIDGIFQIVRGGHNIGKRIESLNSFLDVAAAKRKRSARVIINTMIVIEALKAAMNHFNESSAGFVFEAFMAALTQGRQEAGRVGGTLPIEDFIAWSEGGGTEEPVSLKLLGKKTNVKGSFSNLVDYLFVRNADKDTPAIKYLVAYKHPDVGHDGKEIPSKVEGEKGDVGALEIHEFVITRNNLIGFLNGGSAKTKGLVSHIDNDAYQSALGQGPNGVHVAMQMLKGSTGYNVSGMLQCKKNVEWLTDKGWDLAAAISDLGGTGAGEYLGPEGMSKEDHTEAWRKTKYLASLDPDEFDPETAQCAASENEVEAANIEEQKLHENWSPMGAFHTREKNIMQRLLTEGKEEKHGTQWEVSFNMIKSLSGAPVRGGARAGGALEDFAYLELGTLDFTTKTFGAVAEVYAKTLEGDITDLLGAIHKMTENINRYFNEPRRNTAIDAGKDAQKNMTDAEEALSQDVKRETHEVD